MGRANSQQSLLIEHAFKSLVVFKRACLQQLGPAFLQAGITGSELGRHDEPKVPLPTVFGPTHLSCR